MVVCYADFCWESSPTFNSHIQLALDSCEEFRSRKDSWKSKMCHVLYAKKMCPVFKVFLCVKKRNKNAI